MVISPTPEFDSHAQDVADAASGAVPGLDIGGEYHAGASPTAKGVYTVTGSAGDDEIIINEHFQSGSQIWASAKSSDELTGAGDANHIELNKGMSAENGAVTTVNSDGGELIIGSVSHQISPYPNNYYYAHEVNILAQNGGQARVDQGGDLRLSFASNSAITQKSFISQGRGALVDINVGGDIIVSSPGDYGGNTGLVQSLNGAEVSINAGGAMKLEGVVSKTATIFTAERGGTAHVSVEGLDIDVTTTTSSTYPGSMSSTSSFISGSASATEVGPSGERTGVTVESRNADINVHFVSSGNGSSFSAMSSYGLGSEHTLKTTGSGDINITFENASMLFYLMNTVNGGRNNIESAGDVIFTADGKTGYGLYAAGDERNGVHSVNTITAEGDVLLEMTNKSPHASITTINGTYGMNAASGENHIDAGGDVTVRITAEGTPAGGGYGAYAMYTNTAYLDSINTINARNVHLEVDAAALNPGSTPISGMTASIEGWASNKDISAKNEITAQEDVRIEVTGKTAAGMRAAGGSVAQVANSIIADGGGVFIDVTGTTGNAWGMTATGVGSNFIEANDYVGIAAHTDAASGNAYSMYALGGNASNTIQAGADSEGITVVIEATGGANHFAMYAGSNGINLIKGSLDGNDDISISGNIYAAGGGKNIIAVHDGDNVIRLDGAVGKGSLTIEAGDGHDTLILHADNVEAFNQFYKEWLNNMPEGDIVGMSLDSVQISLDDLAGINWSGNGLDSLAWLSDLAAQHGISLEFNLGGHGDMDLGDLAGLIGGEHFSVIDLTDGGSIDDILKIDGTLESLGFSSSHELYIRGDAGDQVNLADNWTRQEGTHTHDGVAYSVYTDGNGGIVYLEQEAFFNLLNTGG